MSFPYLVVGQKLRPNQSVASPSMNWKLWQQEDGNLVLYNSEGTPKWQANTATGPGNTAVLQADGNFVIYNESGTPLWAAASNRSNFRGVLVVTDEGRILIQDVATDVTNVKMRGA